MKPFFKWQRFWQDPQRPVTWSWWPIKVVWQRGGNHAHICWHSWPERGSEYYPDATAKTHGWTLHLGNIKIIFGRP